MAENLITCKLPPEALEHALRLIIKERLERLAEQMRNKASAGVSPIAPSNWTGNVVSHIKVEDLGSGGGVISFGLGLENGTPEQALWQAYIYNFGSGQFGKNGLITSQPSFYNVHTDNVESGRTDNREYPQFGKQGNRWFTDVIDANFGGSGFSLMLDEIVEEAVSLLFRSGAWQLKGNDVEYKIF